ncbi:hypothetical protein SBG_0856 [Salmonella bongori NCTC 12419]|uniref:Uncharacterized protein n=1 Tax=Salmonella bongori (strain ATCC 43975 / DSM 13772 / NCTC 12419) TaxID=218493 RepID=A0A0K0H985_SALBC|nr:hypothetical protein SBG_0856 [Salmonella bongori NCTC 12419]
MLEGGIDCALKGNAKTFRLSWFRIALSLLRTRSRFIWQCPFTCNSPVEPLKLKWLVAILLHFYNMGHEMRSTLKTAYGVIGVQ